MSPQNSRILCHCRTAVMTVIIVELAVGMRLSQWVERARSPGSSTACRSRLKNCVEYLVWWCDRDMPHQWSPNHTYVSMYSVHACIMIRLIFKCTCTLCTCMYTHAITWNCIGLCTIEREALYTMKSRSYPTLHMHNYSTCTYSNTTYMYRIYSRKFSHGANFVAFMERSATTK